MMPLRGMASGTGSQHQLLSSSGFVARALATASEHGFERSMSRGRRFAPHAKRLNNNMKLLKELLKDQEGLQKSFSSMASASADPGDLLPDAVGHGAEYLAGVVV